MAFCIFLLLFCIFAIKYAFVVVPEGYQYVLERLGKFYRVLTPGLHIIVPFIDMVGAKINTKEQAINFPQKEFITKDEYAVLVEGSITFQITDAVKATYNIRNLYEGLLNLVFSCIQTAIEERTKDEVFTKKAAIGYKLTDAVNRGANNWGTKIIRVDIQDISLPPTDYFEKPKNYYNT